MTLGQFAKPTATGAQLWEIWGRHKWSFVLQAVAFPVCLGAVQWKATLSSEIGGAVLSLLAAGGFVMAYLQLLMCFGYVEADMRTVKVGFPGRLFHKPVSTARLVAVPMVCGGIVTLIVFLAWANWILRPLGAFAGFDLLWIGLVQLSLFWWLQAMGWSLPPMPGRSLVILLAGIGHLLPGLMPQVFPELHPGWRWLLLGTLFVAAWTTAGVGLSLMRRGIWDDPPRLMSLWKRLRPARSQATRKKFRSAFHAQLWLEWNRQGVLLPGMSGCIALVVFPMIFLIQKKLGDAGSGGAPELMVLPVVTLVLPMLLSGAVAPAMAKFDPLQPSGELPIYIAVRPMTNGGFVVVKLAMALLASALACLFTWTTGAFWMVILGDGSFLAKTETSTPYGPVALVIGCVPLMMLLVLLTWKNLVAGIGVGLTGRRWVSVLAGGGRMLLQAGFVVLVLMAKLNPELQETLLRWLPTALVAFLVIKIAFAAFAFRCGLRRSTITAGAVGWIGGGWLLGGIFLAAYSALICQALGKTTFWPQIATAGFVMLPLADLAIAPLAIAWNRHR